MTIQRLDLGLIHGKLGGTCFQGHELVGTPRSPGVITNGNDTFTKVLLHFDGTDASTTITDSSVGGAGSPHTFTANGNAQIDTAQSKFGGASGLFDGTGDWVSTPDHADFALGSSDFTVDFWVRRSVDNVTHMHCGQFNSSATATSISFYFQTSITTSQAMRFAVNVGSTSFIVDGSTVIAADTWFHIAGVRTGSTLKLFINGTQEGGDVAIAGSVNDSTNTLSVGRGGELTSQNLAGWIDEFRLSVGVARWTSNFTPPTGAYS